MFTRLKLPRDEKQEELERLRNEKLTNTAFHLFECAAERHDAAMEAGHHEQADDYSQTASWWFNALTGRGAA